MKPDNAVDFELRGRPFRAASISIVAMTLVLSACLGDGTSNTATSTSAGSGRPVTAAEASRFLAQASMGASDEEIAAVQARGYTGWIDDQIKQPQTLAQPYVEAMAAKQGVGYFGNFLPTSVVYNAFWARTATGGDQLRQRVAWALSQIFVISLQVATLSQLPRGVANYLDMLGKDAFGNYRTLLQDVTLHPAMGIYLSAFENINDPAHNAFPNQNYAREVMQLFSIGLIQLNQDGSPKLQNGKPVPTYGQPDIVGLSHVFTGFGWYASNPDFSTWAGLSSDPNRDVTAMSAYPYHSSAEKRFLGVDIPAQSTPDAMSDLRIALDTLFNHPNVGPFIGKQLIQQLVTSNPSPAYVARVSQAFDTGHFSTGRWKIGTGSRGDLSAMVAAVLLDAEARDITKLNDAQFGRVREPVLRLSAWMRGFHALSSSGSFSIGDTGNPAHALAMSPMDSPSVFNFYPSDFTPAGSPLGTAGLVAPALKITNASSVVGYADYIRQVVASEGTPGTDPDVFSSYAKEMSLASNPTALVNWLNLLLAYGTLSAHTQSLIEDAVNTIAIPSGDPTIALRQRISVAVTLALCAPEFIVQK